MIDSETMDDLMGLARELGQTFMVTDLEILRSDAEDTSASASTDYGDDAETEAAPTPNTTPATVVKGWFVGRPAFSPDLAGAQLAEVDLDIIRLPLGTDVHEDDTIRVVETGNEYHVINVRDDETWPDWLEVNTRRRT